MGVFEHFPYTNFHELNLDWLLKMIHTLELRLDAAEARLDAAEARLDLIEADIADIRAEIVTIKSRITSLEGRMTAVENRVTALEQRCTAIEGRLASLEAATPVYIIYDAVNPPDPEDYQDIIEAENRPVYLRAIRNVGGQTAYDDYPLITYDFSPSAKTLVFFDAEGTLASVISGYDYAAPCMIALGKTNVLPPHYEASSCSLPSINSKGNKFLRVNLAETGVEWADVPDDLPNKTGNAGKVLAVNAQETGVEWATVAGGGLPAVSAADAGKVLTVNNDGDDVEWSTVSGGGLPAYGLGDAGKVLAVNASEDGVEWLTKDFRKIYASGTVTYHYTDYSSADLAVIQALVAAGIWTDAQLALYDFDLDGVITLDDRTILSNMLANQQDRTVTVTTEVDPDKPERPITLYDENSDPTAYIAPGRVGAHVGEFGRLEVGDSHVDDNGYTELNDSAGYQANAAPAVGMQFVDDLGNRTAIYPADASTFLQANDLGVNNLEGCAYWEGSATGTDTYSLSNDHTYLLTAVRRNSTDNTSTAVWIISSFSGNSNIVALKSSGDFSASVSGLSLTVTKNITYWRVTLTRLA